jgi:hypothetical protein
MKMINVPNGKYYHIFPERCQYKFLPFFQQYTFGLKTLECLKHKPYIRAICLDALHDNWFVT